MIDLNKYKTDSISKEELEEFTDAFMRAKYDDDRKNRWQRMLAGQHNFKRDVPGLQAKPFGRRVFLWAASAAAVGLLIFILMFGPDASVANYEQLADNYLTEEFYENREDSRGEQDIEQVNLKAVFAYNQKDFETAIAHYETIVSSGQANERHHFFLGLSYLYTERPDAAIVSLLKVPELNADSKFIKEQRWFLALAYLKNKQVDQGKDVLLSILPSDWKYQEAQQLLEAIAR